MSQKIGAQFTDLNLNQIQDLQIEFKELMIKIEWLGFFNSLDFFEEHGPRRICATGNGPQSRAANYSFVVGQGL